MCGIAGVVGTGAGALADRVRVMVDALEHRGPDQQGLTVFDDAVLGSARLAVIDPDGGRQPLLGPDDSTALVCNGEIYGHRRIRAEHGTYPFRTGSDCEVVLALHDAHGTDLLPHLPGTFAFALWDDRDGELLLARDRFGERPLYYTVTGDGLLAFASESRALRAAGFVPGATNRHAVSEMLRQGYVPSGASVWQGVEQVPHASELRFRVGATPLVRRWWTPPEPEDRPVAEAVEWFRAELDRAVSEQLVADVPVGAFLSGGIDSSTVASLAARHHRDLHAFTFDMPEDSELGFAASTAQMHGMQLHVCRPDASTIAEELLSLPEAYDEPFGDSSALPTRLLCRFAREHVTVSLTGDGADELLGGYLVWTRGLLPAGTPGSTTSEPALPAPRRPWWRRQARAPRAPVTSDTSVARRYASFRQYFDAPALELLGLPGTDAADVDVERYGTGTADDICRFDLDHYLPGDILVKTDRASMAHGLEVRAPFLDVAVAEGCLALPAHHKVDATHEKLLLRRAFPELWPTAVAQRPKQGFGAPMARWLSLPEVAEVKAAHLVDPSSALFDLVDHDAVQPYVDADDQRTWNLLMLSIWWTRCRSEVTAS